MAALANDWLLHVPGAGDFAAATLAVRSEIEVLADVFGRAHPCFRDFLATITDAEARARNEDYWRRFERAFAGDWEALAERLRINGVIYARTGATLADWQALAELNGEPLFTELVRRLAAEPDRLTRALQAHQMFYDRAFVVFVEAYQVASQTQLHQSDQLFRRSPIAMVVVDAHDWMREGNDAFLAQYGLTTTTLQGRTFESLFEPENHARARALQRAEAIRTGRAGYDTVHLRADCTQFPVRVEASRLSAPGQPDLWGVSLLDLSEREQLETMSRRSAELEAENESVRQASRVKSEFLANMSHELRTPLNSILGFSELLVAGEVGPLAAQQLDFLQDIHTSGKHLLGLINDVLDLAKVESGKLEFFQEDVDLALLVRGVVQMLRPSVQAKSLAIDIDVASECRAAWLDPARLKQVLYNYLSNAIKFSHEGGRIEVRVRPELPDRFRLEVTDHGAGISVENQQRLFVMFEQLDAGRAKTQPGTGLGLALTRRLVDAQGGSVGVSSTVGLGSTFWAVLPLRQREERLASLPVQTPTELGPVLIIEDDEAAARLMSQSLARLGFRAVFAHDGLTALELAREVKPAAVVLDLEVSKLDGFGFLRRYRQELGDAYVPVLVWSVKDLGPEERREALRLASAVIPKHRGDVSNLLEILRTHLGLRRAPNV